MASGIWCNLWLWLAEGTCGWNLWVWLVGVGLKMYRFPYNYYSSLLFLYLLFFAAASLHFVLLIKKFFGLYCHIYS